MAHIGLAYILMAYIVMGERIVVAAVPAVAAAAWRHDDGGMAA